MSATHPRRAGRPRSDASSDDVRSTLVEAYRDLLRDQLEAWSIPPGMVGVHVHHFGRGGDGLPVFIGMLRLARWVRVPGFRLLLGLPLLEASMAKAVSGSWLAEFSHFAGVWLHASSTLHAEIPRAELAGVLEGIARSAVREPPDDRSYWASLDAPTSDPIVPDPQD